MCDYSKNAEALRREWLADMIKIAEDAGLYEDEPTLDEAVEAVKRVRKLHKPSETLGIWDKVCSVCTEGDLHDYVEYPCETIRTLDGEQSD